MRKEIKEEKENGKDPGQWERKNREGKKNCKDSDNWEKKHRKRKEMEKHLIIERRNMGVARNLSFIKV